MKILCVCQKGCVRSVGTKYRLNRRGKFDVVAIGVDTASVGLLSMLCYWVDKILLAEPVFGEKLPSWAGDKVEPNFTIGPDVYGKAFHPGLQEIIKQQLNGINLR